VYIMQERTPLGEIDLMILDIIDIDAQFHYDQSEFLDRS
jgi:hypothetical protein